MYALIGKRLNEINRGSTAGIVLSALLVLAVLLASPAAAQLRIEITKGATGAIPIAVVPFAWQGEGEAPEAVAAIVSADLHRSGLFDPMPEDEMIDRPTRPTEVRFGTWRLLKVDYLVTGTVRDRIDGAGYEIDYYLMDIHSGQILLSQGLTVGGSDLRFGAHRVADAVYEALLGIPGAFSTRIAYVLVHGTGTDDERFELVVADADGHNPHTVVRTSQPILSPAWSPDARQLAYVSFATGRSQIIIQDLYSSDSRVVSAEKGINGAPAFSPDGRKLAVSLSRSGSPEIWVIDLDSGRSEQLTHHWSINTEPVFSPDGRQIYFTSDRAGRPQIYAIDAQGGEPERITWEGRYNARADIGLEDRYLAVISSEGNADFRIAVLDRETERLSVLSDGPMDESPSFAPNGSMVLYATRQAGRGQLAAVSADGRVRQRLVLSENADVREPAWSPLIK